MHGAGVELHLHGHHRHALAHVACDALSGLLVGVYGIAGFYIAEEMDIECHVLSIVVGILVEDAAGVVVVVDHP